MNNKHAGNKKEQMNKIHAWDKIQQLINDGQISDTIRQKWVISHYKTYQYRMNKGTLTIPPIRIANIHLHLM